MLRDTIGHLSQRGSLMASLISHAQDLGTGFSTAVSVSNQADLEICDSGGTIAVTTGRVAAVTSF